MSLFSINIKLVSRNCKPEIIQKLSLLKLQVLTEVNIKTTFNSCFLCACVRVCVSLNEELSLVTFGDRVLRQYLKARNNLYSSPDTKEVMKSTVTQVVMQHAWLK